MSTCFHSGYEYNSKNIWIDALTSDYWGVWALKSLPSIDAWTQCQISSVSSWGSAGIIWSEAKIWWRNCKKKKNNEKKNKKQKTNKKQTSTPPKNPDNDEKEQK